MSTQPVFSALDLYIVFGSYGREAGGTVCPGPQAGQKLL
jgi:hypothetical protein